MKTTTTAKTEEVKARVQSEQSFRAPEGEFHKYIVLRFNRREQVTVFPFAMKHADMFSYMRRECPRRGRSYKRDMLTSCWDAGSIVPWQEP